MNNIDTSWEDYINKIRKGSLVKNCLYVSHSNCDREIIHAHSIQKKKILNEIATNGEVYMLICKTPNIDDQIQKFGCKKATVFMGFCGYHDKIIFQPIENCEFIKSNYQVFLYNYRCFAMTYHKILESLKGYQELTKVAENFSVFREMKSICKLALTTTTYNFKIILKEKKLFDECFIKNEYDVISNIVWEFDISVKFAATNVITIIHDLEGNKIQYSHLDDQINEIPIYFSIFPEKGKTYCIFSWFKQHDDIFKNYKNQLSQLTENQKKDYINIIIPSQCENVVINPESFDIYDKKKKNDFLKFCQSKFIVDVNGSNDIYNKDDISWDLFKL